MLVAFLESIMEAADYDRYVTFIRVIRKVLRSLEVKLGFKPISFVKTKVKK